MQFVGETTEKTILLTITQFKCQVFIVAEVFVTPFPAFPSPPIPPSPFFLSTSISVETQLSRVTRCTAGATQGRGMTKWPLEVLSARVSKILHWHFWAQCWRQHCSSSACWKMMTYYTNKIVRGRFLNAFSLLNLW